MPETLLTIADVRALEVRELARLPQGLLMQRAAGAVVKATIELLQGRPRGAPVVLLVGPGNNGADALLTGLLLNDAGYPVHAILLKSPQDSPHSEFLPTWYHRQQHSEHVRVELCTDLDDDQLTSRLRPAAVLIDGLFGIGQSRALDGQAARLVACINRLSGDGPSDNGVPVVAIDVPSGLDADRGSIVGASGNPAADLACRATVTVTMIADKPGLRTGRGRELAGRVIVADLGVVRDMSGSAGSDRSAGSARSTGSAEPTESDGMAGELVHAMPSPGFRARRTDTHKGTYGTLLIAGGAHGMQGAALLAAGGAQAVGIGKLAISSPDEPTFDPGQPQWMTRGWDDFAPRPDAVVAGCGLGHSPRAVEGLLRLFATDWPLVLDADALSLIAGDAGLRDVMSHHAGPRVLTPHPLEAARLLGLSTADVQRDRIAAARRLATETASVVVLKGAGSVIADRDRWSILDVGGPILAAAGTGDVLAGLTGALLAQGLSAFEAARLAAWAHGKAGDLALHDLPNAIGLRASELPAYIRTVANQR